MVDRAADGVRPQSSERWLFIGLLSLHTFLSWAINMGPLQTGALMEGMGLSSTEAGLVGSSDTILYSFMLVGFPRLPCRFGTRTLALTGLVGAILGNFLCSLADTFLLLCLCRAMVGVSAGLIALAGFAALATASRIDRTSAGVTVLVTLIGAGLVMAAGRVTEAGSYKALFLFTAALAAVCGLAALVLPERRHVAGPPLRFLIVVRSPLTLAAIALSFGGSAVWAFAERIGVRTGLEVSQVGDVLSVSLLAGLGAGVLALVVARPGREWSLFTFSFVCFGAACGLTAVAATPAVYIAGIVLMTFFFVFQGPFFTAITMGEDKTGGLTASITGYATLLSAVAPAVAGALVEGSAFDRLMWLCVGTTLIGLFGLGSSIVRERAKPTPPPADASQQ